MQEQRAHGTIGDQGFAGLEPIEDGFHGSNPLESCSEFFCGTAVPRRRRRLEKVHRNALNLLGLLNNVLDLSKIEARRMTVECEPVDVEGVLRECFESARSLVRPDRVELCSSLADRLPPWQGDTVRLRQVLTNLLGNAAKFTESGHIELRAEMTEDTLLIEVEDTGIGIAQEDLPRIFEAFQQADSSSTRRAGGTGLGLAICRRLCELMGGNISVESEPGRGSRFIVTLPLAQPEPAEDGRAREAAVAFLTAESGAERAV